MHEQLGITTTIPLEIALAGGWDLVDLNNRFVTHPSPAGLVREAEELGLARTLCAWIKGIYAWALANPQVGTIVAVTQGDCSNTHALMELLGRAGRRVVPFDYPFDRQPSTLRHSLERLARELGTDLGSAEAVRGELLPLRRELDRLDRLTWRDGLVSGEENFNWLINSSDLEGDRKDYARRLDGFLARAAGRQPRNQGVRLGLLGVPPIMSDLHQVLDELGGRVVFNEVPRQFAMLADPGEEPPDLVAQYLAYTYPYHVSARVADIAREVERRNLQGLVHYTQSFCFRQMQDLILREDLRVPMLTLEGDRVGPVDARTRMRLEAFVDVLR